MDMRFGKIYLYVGVILVVLVASFLSFNLAKAETTYYSQSFENYSTGAFPDVTSGWTTNTNTSSSIVESPALEGSKSLRIFWDDTDGYGYERNIGTTISELITIHFNWRIDDGAGGIYDGSFYM
jgi:hypothetical protein